MLTYILKRILIFIPTLLTISVLIFMLSVLAPGDPVEKMLGATPEGEPIPIEAYNAMRKQLGMDLPTFYFSMSSKAYPDTLYKIPKQAHRDNLARIVGEHGNWPEIDKYYKNASKMFDSAYKIERDSLNPKALIKIKELSELLLIRYKDKDITRAFKKLKPHIESTPSTATMLPLYNETLQSYTTVTSTQTKWKNMVPAFIWYGTNNQYHRWFSKFVTGDFGLSYVDKRPIADKIGDYMYWTVILTLISVLLTYLIAVPLGVFSARKKDTTTDSVLTTMLFVLYSLPSFWVATLLITFLCQPDYLNWFPPYGIGEVTENTGFFEKLGIRAYHFVLPLFCWTYGSLAFLSRQMRGGMLSVLRQDYIRTAHAKGLSGGKVIWKHAFRNSLLPIITIFANIFPRMIAGSIIIELIFTIPGMGRLLFEAIRYPDHPMVFTIVMLAAFLTMVGYLIADVLYAVADPRITFK